MTKDVHFLYKKFSIGISFGQISECELIEIIKKYKDFIHDVYFSPVEDISFQSRYGIYDFRKTSSLQRLKNLSTVIGIAKENGINISLTLNTKKNIDESFQIYKKYKNLFEIDQVTSISELATIIHQYDNKEKIVCSYNEGIYSIESLQKLIKLNCFSAVVLGNKFLRDFRTFDYVTKNNLECILLINNGCVSECRNFCKFKGVCEQNFRNTLSNITPVELYSKESLFPEELHKYYISNKAIKLFKLSTRPIKKREYIDLLESYITGNSKPYILHNNFNYHLYGRLAFFKEFYNFFEYKDIISEKENIWKNIYFSHNKT